MRHAFLAAAIGLAILVSGGAAGAGQEPGEKPAFKRTSVELLNKSGKVQLVEFYHPTWMGCQKMLPIVHGLEHKLGDRIAFHYFDISDATTAGIQKTLGFKSTPHFFLLSSDGKILGDRSGIIPEAEFEQWLRAAATTKQ